MISYALHSAFSENPEFLLALQLSMPSSGPTSGLSRVTVEFREAEVVAIVGQPQHVRTALGPRILATKQTIFEAILLHHLIVQRGPDFAASLEPRALAFGESSGRVTTETSILRSGYYSPGLSRPADNSGFFQGLDITPPDLEVARSRTDEALDFLEQEGLAIDPAFTPEFMILAGLLPMHFSVRTPKGERVHKEISINAPLWSLEIVRGARAERPYTDFEFKFRGIEIVRKAITAMASQYLEAEEATRRARGKPVLSRKGKPSLDPESEA